MSGRRLGQVAERSDASTRLYNRAYLLGEDNRNRVLELVEVVRYGVDSFGDPDYVTLYGLRPPEWHARGVRLLGRTVVEFTRDALAQRIASDVAAVAGAARAAWSTRWSWIHFAGSANTLYWLARHIGAGRAVGCEIDERVFQATRRNLSIIGFGAEFAPVSYEIGLRALSVAEAELLVVFLAPPLAMYAAKRNGKQLVAAGVDDPDGGEHPRRALARRRILLCLCARRTAKLLLSCVTGHASAPPRSASATGHRGRGSSAVSSRPWISSAGSRSSGPRCCGR